MGLPHMQIGEVAEQTGLSLRTIRYCEEVGLVKPTARSAGGFRLYSEKDALQAFASDLRREINRQRELTGHGR